MEPSNPVVAEIQKYRKTHVAVSPKEMTKLLKKWDGQMYEYAKNLEFEQAAAIRDEIQQIKELAFKEAL